MRTLRLAKPADVPGLTQLIAESARALSAASYSPEQIEASLRHVFGVDTQLVLDETYYVITVDEMVVASGGWSMRRTLYGGDVAKHEPDTLLDPAHDAARIRAFFVRPGWTRQGLARLLYDACKRAARSRGFTHFELVATLPGEPLYRALGFSALGPVEVPLGDRLLLPCIRMGRTI